MMRCGAIFAVLVSIALSGVLGCGNDHSGATSTGATSASDASSAIEPSAAALEWRPGQPVPEQLLKYRNDSANPIDAGGLLPGDSCQVYRGIDSYPLLHAVLFDRRTDPRVFDLAAERALLLVGPRRVFGDLRRDARLHPECFAPDSKARTLVDRAGAPHVWIEAAFIHENDMPLTQATNVLDSMAKRIRAGESWTKVLSEVEAEHSYREGAGTRTRVGNLGEFVLSMSKRDAEPFRSVAVSEATVRRLLTASPGDTLVVQDSEQDQADQLILYHVIESYVPSDAAGE